MHKLFITALLVSASVQATELDPTPVGAPNEIIVREDASGNREVFKVAQQVGVTDDEAAIAVIENYVTADNKVETLVAESELDQVSSTEAWYYWGRNWYGYNYSYNWYGHIYHYRPYFSYNYRSYSYFYYRWW
jgi:hypothetical protein